MSIKINLSNYVETSMTKPDLYPCPSSAFRELCNPYLSLTLIAVPSSLKDGRSINCLQFR